MTDPKKKGAKKKSEKKKSTLTRKVKTVASVNTRNSGRTIKPMIKSKTLRKS